MAETQIIRAARPGEFPDREPVPEGYRLVLVDEFAGHRGWRPASPGRRCRWTVAGRKACGAPAVAELHRGGIGDGWWGYCAPDHLYGRKVEDGRLLVAVLVADAGVPS